jgi:hypothetical protein
MIGYIPHMIYDNVWLMMAAMKECRETTNEEIISNDDPGSLLLGFACGSQLFQMRIVSFRDGKCFKFPFGTDNENDYSSYFSNSFRDRWGRQSIINYLNSQDGIPVLDRLIKLKAFW